MKPLLPLVVLVLSCQAVPKLASDGGSPRTSPDARFIPTPTGACPTFKQGALTFSPGGRDRKVLIWIGPEAETLDGPLVFFWHGAGGDPSDAGYALSQVVIHEITALGGIVAAPVHDPNAGSLPWYLSGGGSDDTDLKVADEIVGCAAQSVGVDLRHIHSVGFSAGAMHNTQFAAFRSGYLASIVNYSGARLSEPDEQDPSNKYPAMLFHGGPSDQVLVNFESETQSYRDALALAGHFAFICDHGLGHTVPETGIASAWRFLLDHPFGERPDPYSTAFPEGFPSYCSLPSP